MTSSMTTAQLKTLTGSTVDDTTAQAFIDEADREINAYLGPYALSNGANDVSYAACSKLARAALVKFLKPEADVTQETKDAYRLLDQYLQAQYSIGANRVHHVLKV